MIERIIQEANLSQESILELEKVLEPVFFAKGNPMLREGEVCKHLYLIEKGLVRLYYIDKKGRDISHWFSAENQIVSVPKSFFYQTTSNYFMEALEPVEARRVSLNQLNQLFEKSHEIEKFGRLLTLQLLIELNDKLLDLQLKTAKERYQSLLELHPDIFNRVSLGHIATYIGITQQSLSRIRTER